jgi:hypothetical protein
LRSFPPYVQKIIGLDKKARRASNPFARRVRHPYGRHDRFSRKDLVDVLRDNDIRSTYKLKKVWKPGDPKVYNYYKEFGSWDNVRLEVWGDLDVIGAAPMDDPEYHIRVVRDWGLYSARAYRAARKKAPTVVPSMKKILTHWGAFSKLVEVSIRTSTKGHVTALIKLCEKMGCIPSAKDCRDAFIDLESILVEFGSIKALKQFLALVNNKKRRGNK